MADNAATHAPPAKPAAPAEVTPAPADEDNEALLDARKTFVITVIGSILFCTAAAAVFFGLGM